MLHIAGCIGLYVFLHNRWMGKQMEAIMAQWLIWRGRWIEAGKGLKEWNDGGD